MLINRFKYCHTCLGSQHSFNELTLSLKEAAPETKIWVPGFIEKMLFRENLKEENEEKEKREEGRAKGMKDGLGLIHGGGKGWGIGMESRTLWNTNCTKGNVVDLLSPRIIQSFNH